jgi:hypothetical protein
LSVHQDALLTKNIFCGPQDDVDENGAATSVDEGYSYHQLGNAVSPPVVAAVGASLVAFLKGEGDEECAQMGVAAALRFVSEALGIETTES